MSFSWGYNNSNGPHTWSKYFEKAGGSRQSPINIEPELAQIDDFLVKNALQVNVSPNDVTKQVIEHTGHNFSVSIHGNANLSGGPLAKGDKYHMAQFHFHWGNTNCVGSEHQLHGKNFPGELHMVFWNATKFSSVSDALQADGGVAVLGIFLELGAENAEFSKLVPKLTGVDAKGKTAEVNPMMNLSKLIPNIKNYYTYLGSLTTPPCYESVTWIVFNDPISISEAQLTAFRTTHKGDGCYGASNYRPPVPLGNRPLKASFCG